MGKKSRANKNKAGGKKQKQQQHGLKPLPQKPGYATIQSLPLETLFDILRLAAQSHATHTFPNVRPSTKTLARCALVCRKLNQPAVALLHERLYFNKDAQIGRYYDDVIAPTENKRSPFLTLEIFVDVMPSYDYRNYDDDWATYGAGRKYEPVNPKLGDLLSSCPKLKRLYLHGARRIHHEWLLSPALNNLESLNFQNSGFEIELDAPFNFQLKEFGTDTLSPPAFKRLLQDAVPPPSEGPIPARLPALKSLDISKVRFTSKEELKELLDDIAPLAPTLKHFGIPEFLHADHYSYFRPSALPKEVPEDTIAFLKKTTKCLKSLVVPTGIQENVKYYLHHLAGFARLDRLSVHLFDDTTMPILSQFINRPILRTAQVIEVRDQEMKRIKKSKAGKRVLKKLTRNGTQLQTNDRLKLCDYIEGDGR
ncbi:hypothetical protein MNV49_007337 [Pseudohyphozyma bogoriensis]|nr:hypothetical protein MNV49_007337 [Pseudohyphozyma bogoriensis]